MTIRMACHPSTHGFTKFCCRLLFAAVVTGSCTGCNIVVLLGYLIGGPPSIEPVFDKQTGRSLRDDDKQIAVICYAPRELKFDVDDIDATLAQHVAYQLNRKGMTVVSPDLVQAWLDKNDDWDSPAEIGKALEVDWVIYIDLHEYALYEKGVTNLYRGRTDAMVQVFDMNDGEGVEIFVHDLTSVYPLRTPKPTSEISYNRFKLLYHSRLSDEIGRLFYEHYAGDDISHGVLD